jgi:hypothetical protein
MNRFTKDDNASARLWTEQAIKLDPKFSDAYSTLGWIYFFNYGWQWTDNPKADFRTFERAGTEGRFFSMIPTAQPLRSGAND